MVNKSVPSVLGRLFVRAKAGFLNLRTICLKVGDLSRWLDFSFDFPLKPFQALPFETGFAPFVLTHKALHSSLYPLSG